MVHLSVSLKNRSPVWAPYAPKLMTIGPQATVKAVVEGIIHITHVSILLPVDELVCCDVHDDSHCLPEDQHQIAHSERDLQKALDYGVDHAVHIPKRFPEL